MINQVVAERWQIGHGKRFNLPIIGVSCVLVTCWWIPDTKKTYACQHLQNKPRKTCDLSNLIFLISCGYCGRKYCRETKQPFRQRIYEHIRSVLVDQEQKSTPVSTSHFTQPGHSVKHMQFAIIHWMGNATQPDPTPARRSQEMYYIWLLPTLSPAGAYSPLRHCYPKCTSYP